MIISKKDSQVDILRCPLCWAVSRHGVIEHLKATHRRTEIEAQQIMERNAQGTLGWDPEIRKKRAALRALVMRNSLWSHCGLLNKWPTRLYLAWCSTGVNGSDTSIRQKWNGHQ